MLARAIRGLQLPLDLDRLRDMLRGHGVIRARLYGSLARGEGTPTSDIDILVDLASGRDITDIIALTADVEEASGRRADITTAINPHFLPYIEQDFVDILDT